MSTDVGPRRHHHSTSKLAVLERENTSPTTKSKLIKRGRHLVPEQVKELAKFHTAARKYVEGDRNWARNALTDEMTRQIAKKALGDSGCSLDIGASVGSFAMSFSAMAPKGQHFAFEPVPASFATLSERATKRGNLTLHNAAVGAKAATMSFMVGDDTGLSGFKTTGMMLDRTGNPGTQIQVDVLAIDDLALPKVDMVKIDVEGAELEVLKGARTTFSKDRPWVVFEHTDHSLAYDENGTSGAIFDLATEMGLAVSTLDFALGELPPLDRDTFIKAAANRWFEYFALQP